MHLQVIFLEGVSLDRLAQGRKPRFVKGEPPTAADIADVVQTISGYPLKAGHYMPQWFQTSKAAALH